MLVSVDFCFGLFDLVAFGFIWVSSVWMMVFIVLFCKLYCNVLY